MSHNVRLDKIKFSNLAVLRAAVEEMKKEGANIDLIEGTGLVARASGVGAQDVPCEVMIRCNDYRWDVAFNKTPTGEYVPECESMFRHPALSATGTAKTLDPTATGIQAGTLGALQARYAVIQAETNAAMQGLQTTRSFDEKTRQFELEVI